MTEIFSGWSVLAIAFITAIFNYLYFKANRTYKDVYSLQQQRINQLQCDLHKRTKKHERATKFISDMIRIEADNKKTDVIRDEEYDRLVGTVERCRTVIAALSQIGMYSKNVWLEHAVLIYRNVAIDLVADLNQKVQKGALDYKQNVGELTRDQTLYIKNVDLAYKEIIEWLRNDKTFVENFVTELFDSAYNFFCRSEEYRISSGPVPRLGMDADLLNGSVLNSDLTKIIKKYFSDEKQIEAALASVRHSITEPLHQMVTHFDNGKAMRDIGDHGSVVKVFVPFDVKETGKHYVFFIPLTGMYAKDKSSSNITKNLLKLE